MGERVNSNLSLVGMIRFKSQPASPPSQQYLAQLPMSDEQVRLQADRFLQALPALGHDDFTTGMDSVSLRRARIRGPSGYSCEPAQAATLARETPRAFAAISSFEDSFFLSKSDIGGEYQNISAGWGYSWIKSPR